MTRRVPVALELMTKVVAVVGAKLKWVGQVLEMTMPVSPLTPFRVRTPVKVVSAVGQA